MRGLFDDYCEQCIKKVSADKLSGLGILCNDCDPDGVEREGSYYEVLCDDDRAAENETLEDMCAH